MARSQPLQAASTVAELVDQLKAANGTLKIPNPNDRERRRWRQTLYLASNEGGLPAGQRLRYSGRDRGDLEIRMVPDTPGNQPRPPVLDLPAIPVPDDLRGLHPLLVATRKAAGKGRDGWIGTFGRNGVLHMHVATTSLDRVLRLAQALISETERRGGAARPGRSGIGLALREPIIDLVFTEEKDRGPHELTAKEARDLERHERQLKLGRYSFLTPPPKYDYFPSGRLVLRTGHDTYGTTLLANDRVRWTFESRLPMAMAKVEQLTIEAEEARAQAEAEARRRERAWSAAMAEARHRWGENHRLSVLQDQLQRRRQRVEIEALVNEFRAARQPESGSSGDAWLAWITAYADSLDPRRDDLALPEVAAPSGRELQELLGNRWSVSGPEASVNFYRRYPYRTASIPVLTPTTAPRTCP